MSTAVNLNKKELQVVLNRLVGATAYLVSSGHTCLLESTYLQAKAVLVGPMTIGFTPKRRAYALATLQERLATLFEQRFALNYEEALSARFFYHHLLEGLAKHGVEDLRDRCGVLDGVLERGVDERHVLSMPAKLPASTSDVAELKAVSYIFSKPLHEITQVDLDLIDSNRLLCPIAKNLEALVRSDGLPAEGKQSYHLAVYKNFEERALKQIEDWDWYEESKLALSEANYSVKP